jgi:hypothetical protein
VKGPLVRALAHRSSAVTTVPPNSRARARYRLSYTVRWVAMAILADQMGAVGELPTGQLFVPLASELSRLVEGEARRMGENQSGLSLQAATVSPGAILQPSDRLIVKITYQDASHKGFSKPMLS